jgi:hypothetical protein
MLLVAIVPVVRWWSMSLEQQQQLLLPGQLP